MSRVTGSYGRPIHGVSQLPDTSKLVGQSREQINCVPDLVDGLRKRQGTTQIVKLLDSLPANSAVHAYTRDETEAYFIIIKPNDPEIYVYDLLGRQMIVNRGSETYQIMDNPLEDSILHTISDYTFLVNKGVTVQMEDTLSDSANSNTAIVEVKFATYGRTYTIFANGIAIARYKAPTGELPDDIDLIDTSYVAQQLGDNSVLAPTSEGNMVVTYDEDIDANIVTLSNDASEVYTAYNHTTENSVLILGFTDNIVQLRQNGANSASVGDLVTITYAAEGELIEQDDYEISRYANTLFISRKDGEPFSIDTEDGADGTDMVAIWDVVDNVSKLPERAPNGYKIKVTNQSKDDTDDYWLESQLQDTSTNEVLWVETTANGIKNDYNLSTMPHNLIRESVDSDGIATFSFSEGAWKSREVGSENNAPRPNFVDKKINGIGTFQSRLFLVSGDAVNFTRTDLFFDFYRFSAKVDRDDDPVQAVSDSDRVEELTRHGYLNEDLIFFSAFAQYKIAGDVPLTNETVKLSQVNAYPNSPITDPVNIGHSLVFAVNTGAFTGFREYMSTDDPDIRTAPSVTDHVSQYIPKDVKIVKASPTTDILMAYSDETPDTLYIYNWRYTTEKVQEAWHKWVMHDVQKVFSIYMILDYAYFLLQREDGKIYLERMSLQTDIPEDGLPYTMRADRRHVVTATRENRVFRFTPAIEFTDTSRMVVIQGEGCYPENVGGNIAFEKQLDGSYITYDELTDGNEASLVIGVVYDMVYRPPAPFVQDRNGRPSELERLQVGKVYLHYHLTGSITLTVRDLYSGKENSNFYNGRTIGAPNNVVGYAPLMSGTWSVPVRKSREYLELEITANGYLPFNMSHLEWAGTHKPRGRRY